jgi:predicted nucleic acid-binding protein
LILLDTGPIVAFFDGSDNYHNVCIEELKKINEPLITSWPVLTEAFYILGFSWKAQNGLWEFILRGGVDILPFTYKGQIRCRELMEKYRDLPMDLADASLVVLGEEKKIRTVFTLDHRDFNVYRTQKNKAFSLIPPQI